MQVLFTCRKQILVSFPILKLSNSNSTPKANISYPVSGVSSQETEYHFRSGRLRMILQQTRQQFIDHWEQVNAILVPQEIFYIFHATYLTLIHYKECSDFLSVSYEICTPTISGLNLSSFLLEWCHLSLKKGRFEQILNRLEY